MLLHGNAIVIDTLSAVVSLPGCPISHWHADLDDPRDAAWALVGDEALHAPPPGLVAVVPLVNLSRANGPTEFVLGSHVRLRLGGEEDWWARMTERRHPSTRPLEAALTANVGAAILFDLRIRHRGGPNRSPEARPIMYVGYTMRWFRDAVNFKASQTKLWGALPSRTRRALFARVDSQAYTWRLEAELAARGVDVAALRSDAEYKASDLVV